MEGYSIHEAGSEREATFEKRAEVFEEDFENGVGFQTLRINSTELNVGTGRNEGLVIGKRDLIILKSVLKMLHRLYSDEHIVPTSYSLVELPSFRGVQEFVERPTLNDLINFLKSKKDHAYLDDLSERGLRLSETFYAEKQNGGVTLNKLQAVEQELYEHATALGKYGRRTVFANRNVLVLHEEKNGRVAIAPVDVE